MPTVEELSAICREWTPFSLATFYNWIGAATGFKMPPHMWPVCLALTDSRIYNLQLIIAPGSGKSYLLSTIFPAWLIGHDPTTTILGISAGESLPQSFVQSVGRIIEAEDAFKYTFPNVKPDKGAGWSTEKGIFVTGHPASSPDASYLGVGIGSSALTGKHSKFIICDDLHDKNNAATSEACEKVKDTYFSTIIGRADPSGTRFITAGRRWNADDIYGALMDNGSYVTLKLSAERTNSPDLYYDVFVPDGLECVFTDHKVKCFDGTWVDAPPFAG